MKRTKLSILGLSAVLAIGALLALGSNKQATTVLADGEPNVFLVQDSFGYAAEGDVTPGSMCYWNRDWAPTIVGINATYDYAQSIYTLEYSNHTAEWYGVQFFGRILNTVSTDKYEVSLTLTSDQGGSITCHGSVVELVADTPETVTYTHLFNDPDMSLVDIQLGIYSGGVPLAANGTFSVKVNYVHDVSDTPATYNLVSFISNETTVKTGAVKNGTTLPFAPKDPTVPVGYAAFDGWYDGSDVKWTNSYVVNADTVFTARFTNSTHTVQFYDGATKLGETNVPSGQAVAKPNYEFNGAFGYRYTNWFTDSSFTTLYDFSDVVDSDLVLYAQRGIVFDGVWADNNYPLASKASYETDGSLKFENMASRSGTNWYYQINFTRFGDFISDGNVKHTIRFTYKIDQAGGNINLANGSETRKDLTVTNTFKEISFDFTGIPTKFSFELGAITSNFTFVLGEMHLEVFDPEKPVYGVSLPASSIVALGSNASITADISGVSYSSVVWTSDDTDTVTVSGNSLTATMTGIALGTTTVRVAVTSTEGTFNASCQVTVNNPVMMKVYILVKNGFGNLGSNLAVLSHGSVNLTNTPATDTGYDLTYKEFTCSLYLANVNLTALGIMSGDNVKENSWYQIGNTANGAFGQSYNYHTADLADGLVLTLEGWSVGNEAISKVCTASDMDAVLDYCVDSLKADTISLDNHNSTSECVANYTAAVSALAGLSNTQRKVLKMTEYYSRLQAWAVANGEEIVIDNDGILSAGIINNTLISSENSSIFVIVVVISSMSLAGFGLLALRRRKHE